MGVELQEKTGLATGIVDDGKNAADDAAVRLAQVVKAAGGTVAVAARSGVALRSVSHYLAGREMKRSALVALADACGVTVEWLATGRGPMHPGEASPPPPPPAPPPQPSKPARPPKLFSIVDMDLMAECMVDAVDQLRRHSPHPSWGRAVQIACLLYDQAKERREALVSDEKDM